MEFDDLLSQVLALLQREGRVSYRSIKLRFGIDDDYLEGLKDELIYAKKLAADEASCWPHVPVVWAPVGLSFISTLKRKPRNSWGFLTQK